MADPVTIGVLALTAAGSAVTAAGTLAGGNAAKQAGQIQSAADLYKARGRDIAANEAFATGQREAQEKQLQTRLVQSKLQAGAAASGGGAADPTVLGLIGDIAQRGEYQSLIAMNKGEERARGLKDEATSARMESDAALYAGEQAKKASRVQALGTILGGGTSMYKQYNKTPGMNISYG